VPSLPTPALVTLNAYNEGEKSACGLSGRVVNPVLSCMARGAWVGWWEEGALGRFGTPNAIFLHQPSPLAARNVNRVFDCESPQL